MSINIKHIGIGISLAIGLFIFPLFLKGQQSPPVNSQAYQIMLQSLLDHSVPELSVDQAAALTDKNTIFLDAREPSEYEVSHIADARLIGYDRFKMKNVKDIAKDQKIVVYCSVGYRSEKIAEKLIDAGYTDVHNMYGGIFEWKNQSKEVVNKDQKTTEQVHAFDHKWGIWLNKGEKVYE